MNEFHINYLIVDESKYDILYTGVTTKKEGDIKERYDNNHITLQEIFKNNPDIDYLYVYEAENLTRCTVEKIETMLMNRYNLKQNKANMYQEVPMKFIDNKELSAIQWVRTYRLERNNTEKGYKKEVVNNKKVLDWVKFEHIYLENKKLYPSYILRQAIICEVSKVKDTIKGAI